MAYLKRMLDKFVKFREGLLAAIGRGSDRFHLVRSIVFHLWIPVLSGIASLILFGLVDQTKEIYHSLILDKNSVRIVWSTFSVFWLSFLTWQSARLLSNPLLKQYDCIKKNGAAESPNEKIQQFKECKSIECRTLLWLPRIIGVFPLLGLFGGVIRSSFRDFNYFSVAWTIINIVLIWALLSLYHFRRNFSEFVKNPSLSEVNEGLFSDSSENLFINLALAWLAILTIPIVTAISGGLSLGVFVIFIISIVSNVFLIIDRKKKKPLYFFLGLNVAIAMISMYLPPLWVSDFLGSVTIASLSISSLTVLFSTIYNWGFKRAPKIPSVIFIVLFALTLNFVGLNDNHQIRYLTANNSFTTDIIKSCSADDKSNLTLEDAFKCWFNNRKDRDYFKDKGLDYPVYIASAQGGGIYAAYHSATALSKLNDTIPNFSEHVFAISSVSGGSVGSGVYSALVKNAEDGSGTSPINTSDKENCEELTLCARAKKITSHDFLSPLFSLGLFPDILQRFIPFSINDWDRSRGLEITLEESWRQLFKDKDNILAQSYYQLWHPQKKVPALIINTTTVETGERLLFSPFTIPYSSSKTMLNFKAENPNIPLSTAIGVSARFPIISSTGWFSHRENGKQLSSNRLVDGGYYDNSGLVTARDIVSALSVEQKDKAQSVVEELKDTYKTRLKLINLAIVDSPKYDTITGSTRFNLNGIISPLTTVLNVRETRGSGVVAQAAYDLNRNAKKPEDYRFRALYLYKSDKSDQSDKVELPLGWLLSDTSRQKVDAQSPSYKACEKLDDMIQLISKSPKKIDVIKNNSCVAKSIFLELNSKS